MIRHTFRNLLILAIASAGCSGRGCGKAPPPAAPDVARTAPAAAPAPPRAEQTLTDFLGMLPVQTRLVGVLPASTLKDLLSLLGELMPDLLGVPEDHDFPARIRSLLGVDVSAAGPTCAFALLAEVGPILVCPGGRAAPPPGATRWQDGTASGHTVELGGVTLSFGIAEGKLIAGPPLAVTRVLKVMRKQWPTLRDGDRAWLDAGTELAAASRYREAAVLFPDPSAAPWCAGCLATAAFADPEKGGDIVVRRASQADAQASEKGLEALWRGWMQPVDRLKATPEESRFPPVGDGAVKKAMLPAGKASAGSHGPLALLSVEGDLRVLAAVLEAGLLEAMFDPRASRH